MLRELLHAGGALCSSPLYLGLERSACVGQAVLGSG